MRQSYQPLGSIDNTEIGVATTATGQDILIQQTPAGRVLATLLTTASHEPVTIEGVQVGDMKYWSVPHNRGVDKVLIALTDVLTAVRFLHPSYVQLQMVLPLTTES